MNTITEKTVCSEHGETFYWVNNMKSEFTLVFLPGLTADHRLFVPQISAFKDDFKVIVWDCPCHGKSRPYDEFSYTNITAELDHILTVEKVEKAIFIGQSLGGMIAQYYIDRFPDRAEGFVSIDSVPFGDYYSKSDLFWLSQLEWMCKLFPDKILRSSMAKMCAVTEPARRRMMEMLSEYSKEELCRLMYIGEAAFIPENKEISLPCRCLLLLGAKDHVGKVASYNREWSKRTGYPLITVNGAAHNANDDCPDEVNKLIMSFIEGGKSCTT